MAGTQQVQLNIEHDPHQIRQVLDGEVDSYPVRQLLKQVALPGVPLSPQNVPAAVFQPLPNRFQTHNDGLPDEQTLAGLEETLFRPDGDDYEPELTPSQQQALAGNIFNIAFRSENTSMDDMKPFRIRAAWRIIREIGRIRGQVNGDMFLSEALASNYQTEDPWTHPIEWTAVNPVHMTGANSLHVIPPEVIKCLLDSQNLEEGNYPLLIQIEPRDIPKGFAYLPPAIPRKYINTLGQVSGLYSPDKDVLLNKFIDVIRWVSRSLRIEEGSMEDRLQGRFGMIGLLTAGTIREAFPSRYEIMAWERMLLEEVANLIEEQGIRQTKLKLLDKYGFQAHEIASIVKLGRLWIRSFYDGDLEDERFVQYARLDTLAAKARSACDLRTELMAIKQQGLILGVSRTEAGDEFSDFVDVVKRVSREKQSSQKALPILEAEQE